MLVAAGPRVRVVGVDGLVTREAHERGPAQVVERLPPAREAAQQLAAGVGLARLPRERLAVGGRRASPGAADGRAVGVGRADPDRFVHRSPCA